MRLSLGQFLFVLALAVACVYFLALRPEIGRKLTFAECRPYYASAKTLADTMRIDRLIPPGQYKVPNPFACGTLRREFGLSSHPSDEKTKASLATPR